MTIDIDKTIDATAAIIKIIGDTAVVAMKVGDIALPILQDVGLLLPPFGSAANYLAVALPYITKVATYAPTVSTAMESNKTMIESAVSIGEAVTSPLSGLLAAIPELAAVNNFFSDLDAFLKGNDFTPQDQRFARENPVT